MVRGEKVFQIGSSELQVKFNRLSILHYTLTSNDHCGFRLVQLTVLVVSRDDR